jgi:ankyrin repeat protein
MVPTTIINFRDIRGRTPLHVAVAFNCRNAVESLLYLGANPHIPDNYAQRPIDLATDDNIRELLQTKMART